MPKRTRTPSAPLKRAIHRIVLLHTEGPRAGLWRIVGTDEKLGGLPVSVDGVDFIDHTASAGLVAVKRRYALYREMTPANDFHPNQQ